MLQKLGNALFEFLHILFLITAWIERFCGTATPDQLLRARIIEIHSQHSICDG